MTEVVTSHSSFEQDPPPKEPSDKAWEAILASENAANVIFPQALFAQRFLVARAFSQQARKEKVDLSVFLKAIPPMELALASFNRARIGAHKRYEINPDPLPANPQKFRQQPINNGLGKGRVFLVNLAKSVYADRYGEDALRNVDKDNQFATVVSAVQDDPLLLGLLDVSVEGLHGPEVTSLSTTFKDAIVAFMHKYPYSAKGETDPEEYKKARFLLRDTMEDDIASAEQIIKTGMTHWVRSRHPDEKILLERLVHSEQYSMPINPGISVPDPQRDI